jgi:ParB family transcriptional regulator, chromosome partitioning protein
MTSSTGATQRLADERRSLPITQIRHSISSPRCHYDPASLERLAHWIKRSGLLQPLIVRPLSHHEFEVVAGERRLQASALAGLIEVDCLIRRYVDEGQPIPFDTLAREDALVENLLSERLNTIEESDAILELVCLHVGETREFVISRLAAMHHQAQKQGKKGHNNVVMPPSVALCDEDRRILEIFGQLALVEWRTFYVHRVPLLELPEEVKSLVHRRLVPNYTIARRIARVGETDRAALIERIATGLRGKELGEALNELLGKPNPDEVVVRFESIKRRIKDFKNDPEVQRLLERLETKLGLRVA